MQSAQGGTSGFLQEFAVATGQDNGALTQRMNALDEYAKRYLGLLDQAGINYEVRRVENPAGGANGSVAYWDYVVSYKDQPAYPGTLLGYHSNAGTDPDQLLQSSISNARSAQAYSQMVGEPEARKVYATTPPETYDYSITYTTELRDGQLQHKLNPNKVNYDDLRAAGYEPPAQATTENAQTQESGAEEKAYALGAPVVSPKSASAADSQAVAGEDQSGASVTGTTQLNPPAAESLLDPTLAGSQQAGEIKTLSDTAAPLTADPAFELGLEWDPSTVVDAAGASQKAAAEVGASTASQTPSAAEALAKLAVPVSPVAVQSPIQLKAEQPAPALGDTTSVAATGAKGSAIDLTQAGPPPVPVAATQGEPSFQEADTRDTAGNQPQSEGGSALGATTGFQQDFSASYSRPEAAGRLAEAPGSSAGVPEPQNPASQTVQDVRLRITGDKDAKVDVSLSARGNDVKVVVRTPDAELTRGLREGVSDLVQRLDASGYRSTAVRPAEAGTFLPDPSGQPRQGEDGFPGNRQNQQNPEPTWDQEQGQGRNQSEDRIPQWLDELTTKMQSQPASDRRGQS